MFVTEAYFEKIYRKYYLAIYRYAVTQTKDRYLAERIAQDTFVEAYKKLKKIDDEFIIPGWLLSVARNKIKTRYAKAEKQAKTETLVEFFCFLGNADVPFEEESEFRGKLKGFLESDEIDLILLLYKYGLSIAEVASYFTISVPAAKARLFRIRKRLSENENFRA